MEPIIARFVADVTDSINAHLTERYEGSLMRTYPGRMHDHRSYNDRQARSLAVLGFGEWHLTNSQRRAGEENNYRRLVYKSPSDLPTATIPETVSSTLLSWSDLQVPRLQCNLTTENLADLVVSLHNSYMLPGTIFISSVVNSDFVRLMHKEVKSIDYTIDPNVSALQHNNFRRKQPEIVMTLDVKMNSICIVSHSDMLQALKSGQHYHNHAIVILYDVKSSAKGEIFLDGAKYISSHVVSIEPVSDSFSDITSNAEHFLSKGKQKDVSD